MGQTFLKLEHDLPHQYGKMQCKEATDHHTKGKLKLRAKMAVSATEAWLKKCPYFLQWHLHGIVHGQTFLVRSWVIHLGNYLAGTVYSDTSQKAGMLPAEIWHSIAAWVLSPSTARLWGCSLLRLFAL